MFAPFGSAHLAVLLLTVVVPLVLAVPSRGNRVAAACASSFFVATLVISRAVYIGLTLRAGATGPVLSQALLPMQLCDWGAIAALITLLRPNPLSFELAYFWGLGGTLQALVTPDLAEGFPSASFLIFFGYHAGLVGAVIFMVAGLRLRPVPVSVLRALAASLAYIPVAMGVNALLGTNFGYLAGKPVNPSILDYLAPWPFYIAEMGLIGFVSCLVYYAPFFLHDRWTRAAGRRAPAQ